MCFVQLPCPLLSFLSLDLVVHLVVTPLQTLFNFFAPVFFCFTHLAELDTEYIQLGQLLYLPQN